MVKKFGLESANHKRTPVPTHFKLIKDEQGINVDQQKYISITGNLLYLIVSRPDIAFVVGGCARYQTNPKSSQMLSAKRIIKYVEVLIMVFISPLMPVSHLLDIVMLIGEEVLMIEKVIHEDVSSLEIILTLGLVRRKITFPSLLQKWNTLQLVVVALNCYG